MKKFIPVVCFLILLIWLSGCGRNKPGTGTGEVSVSPVPTDMVPTGPATPTAAPTVTEAVTPVAEEEPAIADYYPFRENTEYIYTGEGNEYASYNLYTDYIADNRAQFRIITGGSEIVKVLENTNGSLILHLSRGETYFRENFIDKTDGNDEILLKEPLVKGTEWTLSDNRRRYISNTNIEVDTPYGRLRTIEVITEKNNTTERNIDYYAKGIGLVKTIYASDANAVTSELSKIKEDTPFLQTVLFYFPNFDKNLIKTAEKEISFQTNDITRLKLQEAFNEFSREEYEPLISANTRINSLYLINDEVVSVDFSKEFVTEMNSGSAFEEMILQCITNTLGNYYGVGQVIITVEGKPYESGHFVMEKGETFKVNMDKVEQ